MEKKKVWAGLVVWAACGHRQRTGLFMYLGQNIRNGNKTQHRNGIADLDETEMDEVA